ESAGIDPEIALLGCHADRNENPRIKALWESIAKKQNGLGLRTISMLCGALPWNKSSAIWKRTKTKCQRCSFIASICSCPKSWAFAYRLCVVVAFMVTTILWLFSI
ncbi:DUF3693 domain-containing protein, partial [Vibrio cholerae]|uniref:DUF3693 domain-containing protein n=1 Tax=Vibrio cholerae TaxID=666 RepID=UPI0021AE53BD